jgi:hypothetical protein
MIEAVTNQPVERDLHQREASLGLREFAQGHCTGKEFGGAQNETNDRPEPRA